MFSGALDWYSDNVGLLRWLGIGGNRSKSLEEMYAEHEKIRTSRFHLATIRSLACQPSATEQADLNSRRDISTRTQQLAPDQSAAEDARLARRRRHDGRSFRRQRAAGRRRWRRRKKQAKLLGRYGSKENPARPGAERGVRSHGSNVPPEVIAGINEKFKDKQRRARLRRRSGEYSQALEQKRPASRMTTCPASRCTRSSSPTESSRRTSTPMLSSG